MNKFMEEITKKLLSFQVAHVLQLHETLKIKNVALDASDTGTGKTYCAMGLSKLLNLKPLIICPKSVITTWLNVSKIFDVEILGIANYEMLKSGKYYTTYLEKVECPYFDKEKNGKNITYNFQLPHDTLVIIDEAHRCKNHKTSTSKLLMAVHKSKIKTLLLSATLSDRVETFRPFGVIFGFYENFMKFKDWKTRELTIYKKNNEFINKIHRMDKNNEIHNNLSDDDILLNMIHNKLFPNNGSRMKIKELGDLFPKNNIISQSYFMENYKEVDKLYDDINNAMNDLKNKEFRSEALGKIIRARQRIELLKIPTIQDLAIEGLDNGYSIAIFVNYKETMYKLCDLLQTNCVIHGEQTIQERNENVESFQNNKSKIIISIIQAGGIGISLHDIHGNHPRMSLISPSWVGQDMVQCLGRIHRAGSKSPAIQKFIYCAKSYEDRICEIVKEKIKNISTLNDGDMVGPNIKVELIGEKENNDENNVDISKTYKGSRPESEK